MEIVAIQSTWSHLIDQEWIDELDQTPFLTRCREKRLTAAEATRFICQQFYYSRHFTRYLCALLFNMPEDGDRLALTKNLFEEMGLGDLGGTPHSQIYREMMTALAITADAVEEHPMTAQLVETMLESCVNSNPLIGLAAIGLGAEAIVPHVYSQIIIGLRGLGIAEEHLEFFKLHVEGDDDHALTMFKIIEREITRDPFQRMAVRQAAKKIIKARTRFFAAITVAELPLLANGSLQPVPQANRNGALHASL